MNILHCLINSCFNQRIIINGLGTQEAEFVSRQYMYIITLYWLTTANLFYPGLSEKVMSYDKAKHDENTEFKAYRAAATCLWQSWNSSSSISTEYFSLPNSGELKKRKKKKTPKTQTQASTLTEVYKISGNGRIQS